MASGPMQHEHSGWDEMNKRVSRFVHHFAFHLDARDGSK
jgi:hypothetical protein